MACTRFVSGKFSPGATKVTLMKYSSILRDIRNFQLEKETGPMKCLDGYIANATRLEMCTVEKRNTPYFGLVSLFPNLSEQGQH